MTGPGEPKIKWGKAIIVRHIVPLVRSVKNRPALAGNGFTLRLTDSAQGAVLRAMPLIEVLIFLIFFP